MSCNLSVKTRFVRHRQTTEQATEQANTQRNTNARNARAKCFDAPYGLCDCCCCGCVTTAVAAKEGLICGTVTWTCEPSVAPARTVTWIVRPSGAVVWMRDPGGAPLGTAIVSVISCCTGCATSGEATTTSAVAMVVDTLPSRRIRRISTHQLARAFAGS